MVGCYLAPHATYTLERVIAAINHRNRVTEILLKGNFNVDLESPDRNKHNKAIKSDMAMEGP